MNRPVWRPSVFIYLGLTSLVWLVFGQTLRHEFVAYDDQNYVYESPVVTAGLTLNGIRLAFTQPHARNWHPLTTLSHMLDSQLFGLNPAGHHFTNVLLHTFAVLLLFFVLRRMTGSTWRSASSKGFCESAVQLAPPDFVCVRRMVPNSLARGTADKVMFVTMPPPSV